MNRKLLTVDRVALDMHAACKRQVLSELARRAAEEAGMTVRDLADALGAREKLGSTAVGEGVAIPHARSANCDKVIGFFARLDTAIDFDAADGAPVDLIFLLIAPEKDKNGADHLRALAKVSRALKRADIRAQLRVADMPGAVIGLFEPPPEANAA